MMIKDWNKAGTIMNVKVGESFMTTLVLCSFIPTTSNLMAIINSKTKYLNNIYRKVANVFFYSNYIKFNFDY